MSVSVSKHSRTWFRLLACSKCGKTSETETTKGVEKVEREIVGDNDMKQLRLKIC